ncbi:MAG: NAD(P)/FAD-dependent oxidoreductase [Gemmatimonas sp.]|nr:NAD(P)/FAD-dependent oxidoreductase [Gemmatimonas sp.]
MTRKNRLVVVGNGMAGARFVADLIDRGGADKYDIVMYGDEPYGNYNRILLSNVLAKTQDPKDIFINPLQWYAEQEVTLHAGTRVVAIDRRARRVLADNGSEQRYDTLVLATGSTPFVPPFAGLAGEDGQYKKGLFVFRTLDDCEGITEFAKTSRKAAVIGGGLLGLEAARGIQELGVEEVHVIHLTSHLMEMQLDATGGGLLKDSLEGMGFRIHLEKSTREIMGNGRVTGLRFSDGTMLDSDLVVIAVGIRPNIDLAQRAGLSTVRGILVGDDLQTVDDPRIYALGECVEHRGNTYGLVAPLWDQARVLAERLTGLRPDAVYTGSRVATKLKVMGVDLSVMGNPVKQEGDEEISYVEQSRGVYKKVLIRDGRVAGAILLGETSRSAHLLQLFDRGQDAPESRSDLLFPAASDGSQSLESLPDDHQICNCNGVSKGQLVGAVEKGCRSLKSLCDATRAGTGCGSCRSQVEGILELATDGDTEEDPSIHYYVPGVPLSKPDLVAAIRKRGLRSVSAVFAELAGGRDDPKSKMGLASLLKTIWGSEYVDQRDARFINDRVHANVQHDGTYSVVPGISGGVTSPDQLRKIADVADKYAVPMVKITGGQRIDLLGVRREQLPGVWRDLGMRSGHAYAKSVRTVKTCVGSEFCRFGLGYSTQLGVEMEERFKGLESPGKLKMGVAGCPRNCSEALVKDVGVVAVEGGRWEVYVGGAGGSHVRKADLLTVADSHEGVLRLSGRFIQYYRENANYLERTYSFVPRIGIERIRKIVVEDADGIGEELDAALQASVDDYSDPWLEATAPAHPAQFASTFSS